MVIPSSYPAVNPMDAVGQARIWLTFSGAPMPCRQIWIIISLVIAQPQLIQMMQCRIFHIWGLPISRGGIFAFDSLEKRFSRNGVGVQKFVSVTAKPPQPIPSDKPAFYMFLPPVMAEAALAKPVFPARGETKAIKALTPHT